MFLSFLACILVRPPDALAQQTVTLTEPSPVTIQELFKQADVVAVVRIRSGTTEQYPTTVYKAEIMQSFKGVRTGAKIFFGPYIHYRLGSEYLVFLQKSKRVLDPKEQNGTSDMNYGRIDSFYSVMYDGYSAMSVEDICIFDGKDEGCDDGVKVNTYQIILPKKLKTFPVDSDDVNRDDERWVRKSVLISFLRSLSKRESSPE